MTQLKNRRQAWRASTVLPGALAGLFLVAAAAGCGGSSTTADMPVVNDVRTDLVEDHSGDVVGDRAGDRAPDGSGPDGSGPDGSGPDGSGPDGSGPDGSGPDGSGPDGSGPDGGGPDGSGPDGSGPDGSGPDGGVDLGPDAPPPDMPGGGASSLFFLGDFATNNTNQLGRALFPTPGTGGALAIGTNGVSAFDVTRDGRKVVVGADVTTAQRFDLYAANPDGSGQTLLATVPDGRAVSAIRISPDGQKVAFIANLDAADLRDVFFVPIAGGAPVKLSPARPAGGTPNQLQPIDFAWSRDSRFVAIVGDFEVDRHNQLYITDTTASSPAPVTVVTSAQAAQQGTGSTFGLSGSHPLFWTAGGKVLFKATLNLGTADTGFRLYQANGDGSAVGVVANTPALPAQIGSFGVSPDGTQLAFSADSTAAPNAYEVFVMPADGSAAPSLRTAGNIPSPATGSTGPDFGQPLYWSPDGTKIAFAADLAGVDNSFEAYVVSASGVAGQTRLAATGQMDGSRDVTQIIWAPDSSTIAFIGDAMTDNDFFLFVLGDASTADQTPTLVQSTVANGDIGDAKWAPAP